MREGSWVGCIRIRVRIRVRSGHRTHVETFLLFGGPQPLLLTGKRIRTLQVRNPPPSRETFWLTVELGKGYAERRCTAFALILKGAHTIPRGPSS